jgi:hypothetical protein
MRAGLSPGEEALVLAGFQPGAREKVSTAIQESGQV